jgi:hypothetical protein
MVAARRRQGLSSAQIPLAAPESAKPALLLHHAWGHDRRPPHPISRRYHRVGERDAQQEHNVITISRSGSGILLPSGRGRTARWLSCPRSRALRAPDYPEKSSRFIAFGASEETSRHAVIDKNASLSFARSSIPDEMWESSWSRDTSRQGQRWKREGHG